MAQFIRLTSPSGTPLRVNMDRVLSYYPEEYGTEAKKGTAVFAMPGERILVRETPEEIDRLVNPTGTP